MARAKNPACSTNKTKQNTSSSSSSCTIMTVLWIICFINFLILYETIVPATTTTNNDGGRESLSNNFERMLLHLKQKFFVSITTNHKNNNNNNSITKDETKPTTFLSSLFEEQQQQREHPTNFCIPTNSCPNEISLRPKCLDSKLNEMKMMMSIEEKHPDYIQRLLSTFHGRRIAMLGDSLNRQQYEMLTCRLGMKPIWYDNDNEPERYTSLLEHDLIDFEWRGHQHRGPGQIRYDYSVADSFGTTTNATTTIRTTNNNDASSSSCTPVQTRIELFATRHLKPEMTDAWFNFLVHSSDFDVIIVNTGVHYPYTTLERYQEHVKYILAKCGELTNDTVVVTGKEEEQNQRRRPLCFFRETFPQHFRYGPSSDDHTNQEEEQHKATAITSTTTTTEELVSTSGIYYGPEGAKCGMIDIPQDDVWIYSQNLYEVAKETNCPIIHSPREFLHYGHEWHPSSRPGDCTHYCEANEVWDFAHWEMIQELQHFL